MGVEVGVAQEKQDDDKDQDQTVLCNGLKPRNTKTKKWEIKEKHLFDDYFLLKLFCSQGYSTGQSSFCTSERTRVQIHSTHIKAVTDTCNPSALKAEKGSLSTLGQLEVQPKWANYKFIKIF